MNISNHTIAMIWIIAGVIIMFLELLTPGMVIVFFGASAVITGILYLFAIFQSLPIALFFWIATSLLLVLAFRKVAVKLFPSDSSYQFLEEDVEVIGTIVDVTKKITSLNNKGRIIFQGTTWPAVSNKGEINPGEKAKIILRDNISWVVEPVDELLIND